MADLDIGKYLKTTTRKEHEATEALLLGNTLSDGSLTLERYRALLLVTARVWSIALVETTVVKTEEYGWTAELLRLKIALEKDRQLLGLPDDPLSGPIQVGNVAGLLGVHYVLLGSTLGGRMIARLLPKCPALSHLPAFNFYEACGEMPKTTWGNFQRALAERVKTPEEAERCVEAAQSTFRLYHQLYER